MYGQLYAPTVKHRYASSARRDCEGCQGGAEKRKRNFGKDAKRIGRRPYIDQAQVMQVQITFISVDNFEADLCIDFAICEKYPWRQANVLCSFTVQKHVDGIATGNIYNIL